MIGRLLPVGNEYSSEWGATEHHSPPTAAETFMVKFETQEYCQVISLILFLLVNWIGLRGDYLLIIFIIKILKAMVLKI